MVLFLPTWRSFALLFETFFNFHAMRLLSDGISIQVSSTALYVTCLDAARDVFRCRMCDCHQLMVRTNDWFAASKQTIDARDALLLLLWGIACRSSLGAGAAVYCSAASFSPFSRRPQTSSSCASCWFLFEPIRSCARQTFFAAEAFSDPDEDDPIFTLSSRACIVSVSFSKSFATTVKSSTSFSYKKLYLGFIRVLRK